MGLSWCMLRPTVIRKERYPMNLMSVREETMLGQGGVWVIAGPNWRDHLSWRIRRILDTRRAKVDAYWMGSGRLGNGFPPSGILSSPSADITKLVKQWSEQSSEDKTITRVLVVEDPQGAGIWDGLCRSIAWKTLLENAAEFRCAVMVGTDVGIPRAGLLLDYTDWFHLRSGGGPSATEELTSGTTSLGSWLDGVGRDVFDDIRVYRRILGVMSNHRRDVVIWLSNDSEDFTERVFWWNPDIENKQEIDLLHTLRREANPRDSDNGGGAAAIATPRLVRKLRLVIGLLEEVCEELDTSDDDD